MKFWYLKRTPEIYANHKFLKLGCTGKRKMSSVKWWSHEYSDGRSLTLQSWIFLFQQVMLSSFEKWTVFLFTLDKKASTKVPLSMEQSQENNATEVNLFQVSNFHLTSDHYMTETLKAHPLAFEALEDYEVYQSSFTLKNSFILNASKNKILCSYHSFAHVDPTCFLGNDLSTKDLKFQYQNRSYSKDYCGMVADSIVY